MARPLGRRDATFDSSEGDEASSRHSGLGAPKSPRCFGSHARGASTHDALAVVRVAPDAEDVGSTRTEEIVITPKLQID